MNDSNESKLKNDAATDLRFRPTNRLRSGADFRRVYALRRSLGGSCIVLYAAANARGPARLGLSVSRKVGNAVVRNRWKRLLREAFRTSRSQIPAGMDLIAIPRGKKPPQLATLQAELVELANKLARKLKLPAATGRSSS